MTSKIWLSVIIVAFHPVRIKKDTPFFLLSLLSVWMKTKTSKLAQTSYHPLWRNAIVSRYRHKYGNAAAIMALRLSLAGIVANEMDDINIPPNNNTLRWRRSTRVYQAAYDFVGKTTSGMDGCRANDPDQLASRRFSFYFSIRRSEFLFICPCSVADERRSRVS